MAEYVCKPHEKKSAVRPVAIDYICEFCNEGYMVAIARTMKLDDLSGGILIEHNCTNCGGRMKLPMAYPRIEWEKIE